MSLAAIFALLLQSGICADVDFHSTDGRTLSIMVCPHTNAPDDGDTTPDAPPPSPGQPT
jgi:hypothetical protein